MADLDLETEDIDEAAEAFEEARAWLLDSYRSWLAQGGLAEDDWVAHQLLQLKWGHLDGHLGRWGVADLREILLELFPRKVVIDFEELPEVVPGLSRFLGFLDEAGLLDPASDPLPRLRDALDRLAEPFLAEMRDPANFGPAKSLFAGMVEEGVDPEDPDAAEAWMHAFNALPDDERARLLPGMGEPQSLPHLAVPDEAALADAALQTPVMRQVAPFLAWVGDGRELTQRGNLRLADGKTLVAVLDTDDRFDETIGDRTFKTHSTTDLPGVDLVFRLALKARLARRQKGRVQRTKRGTRLADEALPAWRNLVEAMLDLGLVGAGREDRYGLRWWAGYLEEGVVELLSAVAVADSPLPLEVLSEAAYEGMSDAYDLESLPEAPRRYLPEALAWGVGALVDRLVWLGVATREGVVVEADPWDNERRSGGKLDLTDLGRWFVRPLLAAQGYDVPVTGALAHAPAEELLAAVANRPMEAMEAEVRAWAAARDAPAEELADTARRSPAPDVRAVAFAALEVVGDEAVPVVRALSSEPGLRPWAVGWLVARGEAEPDDLDTADLSAGLVQALAVALVAGGPPAVAETLSGEAPVIEQAALVEELWRVDDPYTVPVLEALAATADRKVSKAARKAIFKHRTARPEPSR